MVQIHAHENGSAIAASLKARVDRRLKKLRPEKEFGTEEGALLPGVKAIAAALQKEKRTPQPGGRRST